MLVAGVDVGAATAKTAIVLDGKLISWQYNLRETMSKRRLWK